MTSFPRYFFLSVPVLLFAAACGSGNAGSRNDDGGNSEDARVRADGAPIGNDGSTSTDSATPTDSGTVDVRGHRLTVAHNTSCFLSDDGLLCWGSNDYGQFGNGSRDMEPLADHPHATPAATSYTNVRSASLSRWASYIVTNDDELWASGINNHGQLPFEAKSPMQVTGIPAVAYAVGSYRVGCFITKSNGEVRCMGDNEYGEVGDGSGNDQASFVSTGLVGVTSLSAGYEFLCAVAGGDVWCWGHNDKGQIGNGQGGDGVVQTTPVKVTLPGDATEVAAGHQHACALLENGDVYCWGINWGHQAGPSSDGTKCGTHDCRRSPQKITTVTDATQLASADAASCAITGFGSVTCWGDSALTGDLTDVGGMIEVASGHEASHFCARSDPNAGDLQVVCWGTNDSQGKLGRGFVVTSSAAQRTPASVALPD